jgi:hypothetical protein
MARAKERPRATRTKERTTKTVQRSEEEDFLGAGRLRV